MNIGFGQCYVDVGVVFPLSSTFQKRLSRQVSSRIRRSPAFETKFGCDRELTINISAKAALKQSEILGPFEFKKTEPVEFTLILPFRPWHRDDSAPAAFADVYREILRATVEILTRLEIDGSRLTADIEDVVQVLSSDNRVIRLWD